MCVNITPLPWMNCLVLVLIFKTLLMVVIVNVWWLMWMIMVRLSIVLICLLWRMVPISLKVAILVAVLIMIRMVFITWSWLTMSKLGLLVRRVAVVTGMLPVGERMRVMNVWRLLLSKEVLTDLLREGYSALGIINHRWQISVLSHRLSDMLIMHFADLFLGQAVWCCLLQ